VNLREHVVLGGGAAAALVPVLGAHDSLVFFASSVLIDVDHYWDYLRRNGFKNWSWRKTFDFHWALFRRIHEPDFLAFNLFHTAEWFALVYAAGGWLGSSAMRAVFWGMLFHLVLDLLRLTWHGATFKRALSVVEYWIRRRWLLRRGLDPDRLPAEVLVEIGVAPRPAKVVRA
jgi:hypothetical protein